MVWFAFKSIVRRPSSASQEGLRFQDRLSAPDAKEKSDGDAEVVLAAVGVVAELGHEVVGADGFKHEAAAE